MPNQPQVTIVQWILPLFTAALGFIAAVILERFRNRTILLKFKRSIFQLGTSTQHNFWGNIEVLYNNRKTNHLSLITVDIKNDSNLDMENVNVDFWVDESSQILAHQGNYVESGNSILVEEKYGKEFEEVVRLNDQEMNFKKENPTHEGSKELAVRARSVLANMRLALPVFNHNTSVKFQILVENFQGHVPELSLSILHKSCKLIREEDEAERIKKQNTYVGWLWLLLYSIIVIIIYFNFSNNSNTVIWTGVLGILSLYLALGLYRLIRLIQRIWR